GGDRGAHHAEQYEQVGGYLLGEGQRADAGPAAYDVCKGDGDHHYSADNADYLLYGVKYLVEHLAYLPSGFDAEGRAGVSSEVVEHLLLEVGDGLLEGGHLL